MNSIRSDKPGIEAKARASGSGGPDVKPLRLPVPVPLLFQLSRPLATMEDVDSLTAQLDSARARGCL
jgi:hypothetical protein